MDTILKKYKLAATPFNEESQVEVLHWGVTELIKISNVSWGGLPYSRSNVDLLKTNSPTIIAMAAADAANLLVSRYFERDALTANVDELARIVCLNGQVIYKLPKETLGASLFALMKASPDVQNISEVEAFFGFR